MSNNLLRRLVPAALASAVTLASALAFTDAPEAPPAPPVGIEQPGAVDRDLFARVARQSGVTRADVQALAPAPALRQPWTLSVTIDGQPRVLDLQPATVRAPGMVAHTVGADGVRRAIVAPQEGTYQGTVIGLPGSVAHVSIVATGLRGIIDTADGHRWFMQPALDALPNEALPEGLHVVHRADHLSPLAQAADCGGAIEPDPEQLALMGRPKGSPATACVRELQLALEADAPFYVANGESTPNTIADMESVINAMNAIYQRDIGVITVITSTLVRERPDATTPATDPYTTTVAGTLLSQFRSWWQSNQTGTPRDLAHLFTGREIDGSTIGIAYVNAMCGSFAYGVSQSRFSGTFSRRVALTAHEIGHNLSASHCNGDTDCAIMCSGLGGCSGNVTRFGTRSVNSIRANLPGYTCMSAISAPTPAVNPRAVNDNATVAAGGTVTIDPLANDFDGNCSAVTLLSFPATTPGGGTIVRLVGAGPGGRDLLRYTALPTFTGVDTVTYSISDGALTGSANILITSLTQRAAETPARTGPELNASYYRINSNVSVPDFTALTPASTGATLSTINFSGTTGNVLDSGLSVVAGRFNATFNAPAAGTYTFWTTSDDGTMLFVNGQLVVANDYVHGVTTASGTIDLPAGDHTLSLGYFNNGGAFRCTLEVQNPGGLRQVVPAAQLPGGVQVSWFTMPAAPTVLPNFANLTPYLNTTIPDLNIPSTGGPFANSGRTDYVGAVYTGFVSIPSPGLWTFYTESDDGSRLLIGSDVVVNNDGLHGMVEASGVANLAAGLHSVRVEFFEAGSGAGLIARWMGPSTPKNVIPASNWLRSLPVCGPSDIAGPGQIVGPDGQLTADDLIVFVNWFFASDQRADVAGSGQTPQPDGQFTADDLIVYVNRFFIGC
jgi:hypothetical protein